LGACPSPYPEYTVDFLRQRGHLVVEHRFAFVRLQRVQAQTAHLIDIRRARRSHRRRDRCRLASYGHRRRHRRCRRRPCSRPTWKCPSPLPREVSGQRSCR